MSMQPKLTADEMWAWVRKKPGLYLGGCSVTALYHTISGYLWALDQHRIEQDDTFHLPDDFHDWVAYRLRLFGSTSGWKNMLLKACGNEEEAFRRFFDLLDEHKTRTAHVFAVAACEKESVSQRGAETSRHTVELVTYTDDPGFFEIREDLTECRWLSRFHPLFERERWANLEISSERLGTTEKLTCRKFDILDQDIVSRLEAEAAAYDNGHSPFRP